MAYSKRGAYKPPCLVEGEQPIPDNTPATKADLEALHQALQSSVTMRRSLLFAPLDDEPYTEEQQRQDAQSMEAIDRGGWVSHQDVCKEFGL